LCTQFIAIWDESVERAIGHYTLSGISVSFCIYTFSALSINPQICPQHCSDKRVAIWQSTNGVCNQSTDDNKMDVFHFFFKNQTSFSFCVKLILKKKNSGVILPNAKNSKSFTQSLLKKLMSKTDINVLCLSLDQVPLFQTNMNRESTFGELKTLLQGLIGIADRHIAFIVGGKGVGNDSPLSEYTKDNKLSVFLHFTNPTRKPKLETYMDAARDNYNINKKLLPGFRKMKLSNKFNE
jgi:hypothetical protein